jgi:hypothetical protein
MSKARDLADLIVGDGGLTQVNFTTADNTKLDGVEALADVTDTTNVVSSLSGGTNVTIAGDGTISSTDTNTTYSVGDGGLTEINFTSADNTKLDGIETSATSDQTQSDINALGITATGVDLGNWTLEETGGVLYFKTLGTSKLKLDASGNLTAVSDVTAYGTM